MSDTSLHCKIKKLSQKIHLHHHSLFTSRHKFTPLLKSKKCFCETAFDIFRQEKENACKSVFIVCSIRDNAQKLFKMRNRPIFNLMPNSFSVFPKIYKSRKFTLQLIRIFLCNQSRNQSKFHILINILGFKVLI